MLVRNSSVFPLILKRIIGVAGGRIAYSMWDGYFTKKFRSFCKGRGLVLEYIHTSGHATTEDLQSFSKALNPRKLIPIHTFEAKRYPDLFENVDILEDRKVVELV